MAAIFGFGVLSAGARTSDESTVSGAQFLSTSALGAAASGSALGLQSPSFEPPALSDPATPGFTINSGADQPDPFMFQQGGRYYLFTSQDKVPQNVPVRSGAMVGQWGAPGDALPDPPAWAEPGVTWAPDVAQFGNHFLLYFTSQLKGLSPATMCSGDAISTAVAGPYIASPLPFVCQQSLGGSIDPRVFEDADGQPYMIWKSDQNARSDSVDTQIYSQPLSADGLQLLGQPTVIFGPDETWQGHIVEAPQPVLVRGEYYLFYSGGWFNHPGYSIGVARCAGPLGPCSDDSSTSLLGSNAQGQGPGEESVFSNAAGFWLLYTPFSSTLPLPGPPRPVSVAHFGFGTAGPYLAAPLEAPVQADAYAPSMRLSPESARVLGSLIEKGLATPQQYPLTINALQSACNQTSNREPVVDYDETTVLAALDSLKDQKLVRFVLPSHGRSVVRYRQVLDETLGLDAPQCAILAVLLLRGPQTVGELRIRTERMARFEGLDEVEHELDLLASRDEPLAHNVGRRTGQKEQRWATSLLVEQTPPVVAGAGSAGEAHASGRGDVLESGGADASGAIGRRANDGDVRAQIAELRAEVAALRSELKELRVNLGG